MLLSLTSDQEFFRETTAKFLTELTPVADLRRRRHDPDGFDADYWRRGAELGWTSLLVEEASGGGSISGKGILDLSLVAYEFGAHASPGPLIPSNVVAGTLSATGSHPEVLAAIVSGKGIATWALGEAPPSDRFREIALEIRQDGDTLVLNGTKRPVESASKADYLLVTGNTGGGLSQVLIPTATAGVTIARMRTVDLTRRFDLVTFTDVRVPIHALVGELGYAANAVDQQLRHAVVMLNAESVGAMQTAFDMTVQWAFDRYSFGRPLASYQALKHRFAEMLVSLECSHAISDDAAEAVADSSEGADELLSAAKAFIGKFGGELMQECVQLHGGIGLTFEHDIHLYFRRHTLNQSLYGTAAEHRRRITDLIEQDEARS